ncbi:Adenylate and Guanylate cyclase catalytic domain-containing protein [Alkalispirochaeta americana]|uniref:Adenylate and Guanylate cyclase catalytic domain-containing protein n=1 Tax=Alkalispirochaeta americana TaxID=159291 RepID=A0A1N6XVS7_9SPIO|nr:hypothetical protein [Alkalispirochaeta americana]SIR06447.1 Adenylate and Guanylate cyclase catalytic domain-containing protein [Alkalispirochaeta americana]
MVTFEQVLDNIKEIISTQNKNYELATSIQVVNKIPETDNIPIEKPNHWLKVPDVICVFADMINSTQLSASKHDKSSASIYQYFTGTIIKIFHEMNAKYIDVKGDGVFALFDKGDEYKAFAAAITIKTFIEEEFTKKVGKKTKINIGGHIGIDQKTVLVKKIGLKRSGGRTDRQNEVWAGKPINMAAKLASFTQPRELLVSDRFFAKIKNELVRKSCDCSGNKEDLWEEIDLMHDTKFDFNTAYKLKSIWCSKHGKEYCSEILKL